MRADCQGCGGFRGRKGGMGCDSFIHLTLKRPLRRGREMSTWRGRLREISILFPSPKRKHSSSSSASTVPEASRTCWEAGGGKREQVGEGIVESCSVPLIPFLFHSCFFLLSVHLLYSNTDNAYPRAFSCSGPSEENPGMETLDKI